MERGYLKQSFLKYGFKILTTVIVMYSHVLTIAYLWLLNRLKTKFNKNAIQPFLVEFFLKFFTLLSYSLKAITWI